MKIKKICLVVLSSFLMSGIFFQSANAEWKRYIDGNYSYIENGKYKTGWLYDNNQWYYLDENGFMCTGWKMINCRWYYLNDDGSMVTGWKYWNGKWYYLNEYGRMVTGWWNVNNLKYYFYSDGSMAFNTMIDENHFARTDGSVIECTPNTNIINNNNILETNTTNTSNLRNNDEDAIITKKNSIEKSEVNTIDKLKTYLQENYSELETPIGLLQFKFNIMKNTSKSLPDDFSIYVEYGDISNSPYDLIRFSPYNLEDNIEINENDLEQTKKLLKTHQKNIADISIELFPDKKIDGCYYDSWYKYEYIKEGYTSRQFYSWKNYSSVEGVKSYYSHEYKNTEVDDFQWTSEKDDYFNN